jgi:hypothetical protein
LRLAHFFLVFVLALSFIPTGSTGGYLAYIAVAVSGIAVQVLTGV